MKNKAKPNILTLIPYGFILFFFLINIYKVISSPAPFYDWDEAIYAQVGREMIQSKSLIPLWQGQIWLDKPPLMPLVYGTVISVFSFVPPEISARILNIALACFVLFLVYRLYKKVIKHPLISTIVLIITAFSPIFLQRVESINIDLFILLGWLGYMLYAENPLVSFLFLAIGVLGKSLIGFYPIVILSLYHGALFLKDRKHKTELVRFVKQALWQVGILSLWYLIMFAMFKGAFWKQHIIESHFRRVSASIESHFGKRTYYVDLLFEQFGLPALFGLLGLLLAAFQLVKKKINAQSFLLATFLTPWFLFLNLTKTKISWYLYPAIPQVAFFITYPITVITKNAKTTILFCLILIVALLWYFMKTNNFFSISYSTYDSSYSLAQRAKIECTALGYLVPRDTRTTFATLDSMGLLITTSKWWGNHPAIVYYSQKPVTFLYSIEELKQYMMKKTGNDCIAIPIADSLDVYSLYRPVYLFESQLLLKKAVQ